MYRALLAAVCAFALAGCSALSARVDGERLTIETLAALPADVSETSGLAQLDGKLWTLNDSGNGPWLYQLSASGDVVKRVRVSGAANVDWEAMDASGTDVAIFDCGNNSGQRNRFQLYTVDPVELERADESGEVRGRLTEFEFADPAPVPGRQQHDNDCEAAAWIGGHFWVFTKGWQTQTSRVYRFAPGSQVQQVESRASWPVRGLITGADYSARRNELVLLGYTLGVLGSEAFIWRIPVRQNEPQWSQARRHPLSPSGQWEAVVWWGDQLLLTRETSVLGEARLGRLTFE